MNPMSERNTVVRSLHDLGLAAVRRFVGRCGRGERGGAEVPDPKLRLRVANAGWARWTPVNCRHRRAPGRGCRAAARQPRPGRRARRGRRATVTKLVLTGAALGVTAYIRALSKTLQHA